MPKKKTSKKPSRAKKPELLPKQELFCQYYATNEEFFGNGVTSYIKAYAGAKGQRISYNTAKSNAYRLLTNADILGRINELLDLTLNDQHVDKQLSLVVTQNADYRAKVAAIKEYNQLKKRVTSKIEIGGSLKHEVQLGKEDQNLLAKAVSFALNAGSSKDSKKDN
jgi:phage terminase small subunit